MPTIVPVLLAGGEGKRLRPLSSGLRPKQFLKLTKDSDDTLLQSSARRALMAADAANVITVAADSYDSLIHQQLSEIDNNLNNHILLEPCARNTAAAITLAAIHASNNFNNPVLWIIPTDHLILNPDILNSAVAKAATFAAAQERIVVFGMTPTRMESNYGYIIGNEKLKPQDYLYSVNMFVEKPNGERLNWAHRQDNFWWNSGMFVLPVSRLFSEMRKSNLAILESVSKAYQNGRQSEYGFTVDETSYAEINPLPIDKVIMEKSKNLVSYPVDIGWSDVGSWQSLWEISQQEGNGPPLDNFLQKISQAA